MPVRIDHVIYATADLDAAEAWVRDEVGLAAVPGGRHEGVGTHNRIVPLAGGAFLELLAVADPDEAERSPLGAALRAAIDRKDGLLGWAVAVPSITPVALRLGTAIATVGRHGMTAVLTGFAEALADPYLPFFIERRSMSEALPTGGAAPAISWIELAGEAARLTDWLAGAVVPVRWVAGEAGVRAVGIGGRELRPR